MFVLSALVLIAVLMWPAVHRSHEGAAPEVRMPRPDPQLEPGSMASASASLVDDLRRWVEAGLLEPEQAAAIIDHERERAAARPVPVGAQPRGRRVPVVAEALGYLGGALASVGLVLVLAHYWPDLVTAGRLALSGLGAAGLALGGALVPERDHPALARLRWFLWLAATAAAGLFVGVLAADALDLSEQTVALSVAGAVATASGLLWWRRDRPLQQITFLGGLAVFVGVGVDLVVGSGPAGLAVGALGVGYLALGLGRRTPVPQLTEGVGALTVIGGVIVTVETWQAFGLVLGVVASVGLLALVDSPRLDLDRLDRLVIGVPAAVGLFQSVIGSLGYFSQDAGVATGLVTWAAGGLLVMAGARRLTRTPGMAEVLGGVALLGGAAIVGVQSDTVAPVFGVLTALGLLAVGMRPGRVLLSVLGALGLLVNVPWALARLFPGEGRVPLAIMVSGALLVAVAVLLTRMGDRFRRDVGRAGNEDGAGGHLTDKVRS